VIGGACLQRDACGKHAQGEQNRVDLQHPSSANMNPQRWLSIAVPERATSLPGIEEGLLHHAESDR
jgi:hypothetical protein